MEVADLQPLDAVYIYPVRLDDCNILDQFKHVQHADYFASNGLEKLIVGFNFNTERNRRLSTRFVDISSFHLKNHSQNNHG